MITRVGGGYAARRGDPERLIARIGEDKSWEYWRSWAAALEDVLARDATLTGPEPDARHRAFLERPHGHDHGPH